MKWEWNLDGALELRNAPPERRLLGAIWRGRCKIKGVEMDVWHAAMPRLVKFGGVSSNDLIGALHEERPFTSKKDAMAAVERGWPAAQTGLDPTRDRPWP